MKKVLLLVCLISISLGNTKKTLYEGFESIIEVITDDMTDKKTEVIYVNFALTTPLYMAISGPDNFILFLNKDRSLGRYLNFHSKAEHLIRVGSLEPYIMKAKNSEALVLIDNNNARPIINSLLLGDTVKVRFYSDNDKKYDIKIAKQSLGYVYGKAIDLLGWEDLGVSKTLPTAELGIYEDEDGSGYAVIRVVGNERLKLNKDFDNNGGGCYITIGTDSKLFGFEKHEWRTMTSPRFGVSSSIIIYDKNDNIVFNKKAPTKFPGNTGTIWKEAEEAAILAWNNSPEGSIEFTGNMVISAKMNRGKVSLNGYKKLWEWGVSKGCLPSIDN